MAVMGLTGCLAGGGSSSSAATTTTAVTSGVAVSAIRQGNALALTACRTYDATVAANKSNPNSEAAYASYFTAAGEAESAAKLAPQWANLAAAFDTVKSDIQQINGLQQSGQSTNTNNAATLAQAIGQLTGNLVAVAVQCAPTSPG
jgi:hypothetical protein